MREKLQIQRTEKVTAETKQLCLWFEDAVLSGSWSLASSWGQT